MMYFVGIATYFGLYLILSSFDGVTPSEPVYWSRLLGCILIGVVASVLYDRVKEER